MDSSGAVASTEGLGTEAVPEQNRTRSEEHRHQGGGSPHESGALRVSWRVLYVVTLAGVAGALFLFAPGGTSLALFILFGGLMVLHHLPGGGHQAGHGNLSASPRDDAHHGSGTEVASEKRRT